jgi:hypothetical protein
MKATIAVGLCLAAVGCAASLAASSGPQQPLLDNYARQAKAADPTFSGFSAARGERLFHSKFPDSKPDTPSCTTCHTEDPKKPGRTRAGKDIDPMAVSASSKRYTDPTKVEKWFGRNCRNVLRRECTPTEKGDFIAFMLSQ